MKKLISMTDFVFYIDNNREFARNYDRILNYAKFLKQPLALWMFVPCDEDGNVLAEKSIFNTTDEDYIFYSDDFDKYQKAKERCLFDGLSLCDDGFIRAEDSYILFSAKSMGKETIEDMIYYDVNLTQTAIKQI